jgi:hypothetical protein
MRRQISESNFLLSNQKHKEMYDVKGEPSLRIENSTNVAHSYITFISMQFKCDLCFEIAVT